MQVVLVEPQIPQNTGSIARTCAATQTPLHLVGKKPFEITEKKVRRAGLDYWPYVSLTEHKSWEEFNPKPSGQIWYFTKFATRTLYDAPFTPDDFLVFGSETTGFPPKIRQQIPEDSALRIPMKEENVRSLNLSNAVSIALYHALWKSGAM